MATRRMFSKEVTNQDAFTEMPQGSQLLYFHLGMHADDDGFLDNYNGIMRQHGFKADDLKVLIAKGFIIPFESAVIVIRHWHVNNQLRKDRYHPTKHQAERRQLEVLDNEQYALIGSGCQVGNQMATEYSLVEPRIAEPSLVEHRRESLQADTDAHALAPTFEQVNEYCTKQGIAIDVDKFYNYYASRGWLLDGKPVKSWKALVKLWQARENDFAGQQAASNNVATTDADNEYNAGVGKVIQ